MDLHYNGFCNSVLWQLFHYVPLNIDSKLSETRTLQFQWVAHQAANRAFAEVWCFHDMVCLVFLRICSGSGSSG